MPSLSVCMMVQNVERTLPLALESLNEIYDELIIVDGGSTDNTCDIAFRYGAKVINSKWPGNHSTQRNVYLQEVTTDWFFIIDSDEFIDKRTWEFLRFVKLQGSTVDTDNFWFPRKWLSPYNQKHYIASTPHFPDFQRRLFKYQKDIFYSGLIHESIHGLTHPGQCVDTCSIYHLDLFINTEEERREKVRRYMEADPRNGALHYYLPIVKDLKLEKWDYDGILPSVQGLINNLTCISNSELNKIILPEIKDDEFYHIIKKIARDSDIKTVLEIGSSSGEGSTEAFVTGLRENPNMPILFCMEVSKTRFTNLQKRYEDDSFVRCYNLSSVSLENFPSEDDIIDCYEKIPTALNNYPLQQVLGWLRNDIEYVKNSGVSGDGIRKIKQENNIDFFDMVLIDGSEFTGNVELDEVYGAKFILLDDINTFKNYKNLKRLANDENYLLVAQNHHVRNGYAIFQRRTEQKFVNLSNDLVQLPVHFFTIVLNGEPFIRYHIEVFRHLSFNWHWHIVEGVADLKHDTAWSLQLGGGINDEIHCNGRSKDGTTAYLDELAKMFPDNVTVYRKPEGVFWNGKREMVNEPIFNIREECLLWQVDVDELWTCEQVCAARQMFIDYPDKTAAFYWCWYFVGDNLVISTRNCYTQNPQQEWLRTWRYKPGEVWIAHEPPILGEPLPNGQWRDVAKINPFSHEETEKHGLIFQHFAYVTSEQLRFKEQYYGYANALSQWKALQAQTQFPVLLRQYFAWVQDETRVNTAESCGMTPIVRKNKDNQAWQFMQQDAKQVLSTNGCKITPTIFVDGVFFQLYRTGIARVWQSLLEEWAVNEFTQHIVVLDRAGTAPKISGIRYYSVPAYDYHHTDADREMLQQVCNEHGCDLFISTYYTTPITTPSVFMVYDMIPEVLGANFDEPMWREKHKGIRHASAYISISENTACDLVKFFPDISLNSVTVAHCGVKNTFFLASLKEIDDFKVKYGVSKPYFIVVGISSNYKNSTLFFKAFAQLSTKQGFDIVCTGSGGTLADKLRAYTSGSTVHMLQLSDEELKAAYSGAVALVYPSKYEGFGLPVLEAIACGCPVITCPNASIPEVAGEAAIYVSEDDVNGLTNALCDVQKPDIRRSLIAAGLEQVRKFSWSKMAETVSSALIDATLLPLNLGEINFIIFPDWSQPEESLSWELERVIRTIATHPDKSRMALLIDSSNISDEDANLILSSVTMNILMQEDLDVSEGPEISLVGKLGKIQWEVLLRRLQARIVLENEDQQALTQAKAETLLSYKLEGFIDKQVNQFFFELGNQFFQQRKWQAAINQYQKVLKIKAGDATLYWHLGECFRQLNLLDEYFSTLRQGIQLYPTEGALHFALIINLQGSGRIQEAISSAIDASDLLPDDYTFKILKNLILPIVYDTQDEISFYRQRFIKGLNDLVQQTSLETPEEQKNAFAGIGRFTNFYLWYQADNEKELQCQYGNLVHQIMAANYPHRVTPISMPLLKASNKIRVGYASAYLHSYSGTLWLTGWLRHHDRQSFEIYCYYIGNEPDAITQQFQDYSDAFYHIPYNLEAVCEQIIADQLHILVFPEIGMNPQTMQIAALRLAPVQCVAWGHPVTSGLPTIDYFLSSELMEPENAQEHYSETLVRLPNIGVSYHKPSIPPLAKTRTDFRLRENAVIYLCCQAPFKYLPQYDFIFPEIARRVPQAQFVFLRGSLLKTRLNRVFASVGLNSEDYCVFLTIPERLDYLMINLLSDVYLDTFCWSGGNTTLEAIACSLPVVTCPGEFMRGRHSDSFLKMLGVTDTIAENEAEYIEIAVRLGLDSDWRGQIAKRMSECYDHLYDDTTCVVGLEAFYKRVVEENLMQTK